EWHRVCSHGLPLPAPRKPNGRPPTGPGTPLVTSAASVTERPASGALLPWNPRLMARTPPYVRWLTNSRHYVCYVPSSYLAQEAYLEAHLRVDSESVCSPTTFYADSRQFVQPRLTDLEMRPYSMLP